MGGGGGLVSWSVKPSRRSGGPARDESADYFSLLSPFFGKFFVVACRFVSISVVEEVFITFKIKSIKSEVKVLHSSFKIKAFGCLSCTDLDDVQMVLPVIL